MIENASIKREEKGFSSIIGLGITVLVLLIAASIFISSLKSYQDMTRAAEEVRGERLEESVQTDIEIENALYYYVGDNLEVKAINTGSTVLETSSVQVFLDGEIVLDQNISRRLVNGANTNVWGPEENLKIYIENQASKPERIKLVSDFGISDYYTEIENG